MSSGDHCSNINVLDALPTQKNRMPLPGSVGTGSITVCGSSQIPGPVYGGSEHEELENRTELLTNNVLDLEGSQAHSPGAISVSSDNSNSPSNSDESNTNGLIEDGVASLVEADDDSYQSLFPLSKKPWTEIPAVQSVSVV